MNQATYLGYVAFEMEVKQTQYGKVYLQNSLNVRRTFKGTDGKYGYDYIPFTVYGAAAEQLAKYVKKGDPLILSGWMASSQYPIKAVDPKTGEIREKKIQTMNLNVEKFEFVPARSNTTPQQEDKKSQAPQNLYYAGDNLPHI